MGAFHDASWVFLRRRPWLWLGNGERLVSPAEKDICSDAAEGAAELQRLLPLLQQLF